MPLFTNSRAFFGPIPYTFANTFSGRFRSFSNAVILPVDTYSLSIFIMPGPNPVIDAKSSTLYIGSL